MAGPPAGRLPAQPLCTLPPDALGERWDWIRREILPHAVETARLDHGRAFELADAPGLADRIDRWVERERACCAGLVFERRASATPGRLRLEIRGVDPDAAVFRALRIPEAVSSARPAGAGCGGRGARYAPGPLATRADRDWTRIGLWLVAATLAYNVAEAVIALAAGVAAGSIALVGFGLDSGIEVVAAGVLLWRLSLETRGVRGAELERAERRVHRTVGVTFLALALYVTAQAGWTLWSADAPRESLVGIALAVASLVVMPLVAWGKLRAAREIGSAALRAEAKETLACSYLSFALLLGLAANAVAGWWWADPAAALAMVPWLVREGMEGVRGEGCAHEDECASA